MKIAFALCFALLCGSALAQGSIDIPLPTNLGDNITIPISSSLTCGTSQTVKILNYALQLEYMQAEYWRQTRAIFEGLGNQTVGTVSPACRNQSNVFNRMQDIESQDNAHASQLNATIARLCAALPDGDDKNECFAVKPCAFNFSFPQNVSTTDDYNGILGKGVQLEDIVVYAYIGMIPQLLDTQASQLLTRIATVDARHAAWARQLTGQQPFPGPLDSPQSRNQVKCSLRQYIQEPNCCAGWQRLQC